MQHRLDVLHEQGFDAVFLEAVRAVQQEDVALDVQGLQLVKPGGDRRLGEIFLQLLQDVAPDVGNRVQQDAPLFAWCGIEKRQAAAADGNTQESAGFLRQMEKPTIFLLYQKRRGQATHILIIKMKTRRFVSCFQILLSYRK